jgi:hypothetical protein
MWKTALQCPLLPLLKKLPLKHPPLRLRLLPQKRLPLRHLQLNLQNNPFTNKHTLNI